MRIPQIQALAPELSLPPFLCKSVIEGCALETPLGQGGNTCRFTEGFTVSA